MLKKKVKKFINHSAHAKWRMFVMFNRGRRYVWIGWETYKSCTLLKLNCCTLYQIGCTERWASHIKQIVIETRWTNETWFEQLVRVREDDCLSHGCKYQWVINNIRCCMITCIFRIELSDLAVEFIFGHIIRCIRNSLQD